MQEVLLHIIEIIKKRKKANRNESESSDSEESEEDVESDESDESSKSHEEFKKSEEKDNGDSNDLLSSSLLTLSENNYAENSLRPRRLCALYRTKSGVRLALKTNCQRLILGDMTCTCPHCKTLTAIQTSLTQGDCYSNQEYSATKSKSLESFDSLISRTTCTNLKENPKYRELEEQLRYIISKLEKLEEAKITQNYPKYHDMETQYSRIFCKNKKIQFINNEGAILSPCMHKTWDFRSRNEIEEDLRNRRNRINLQLEQQRKEMINQKDMAFEESDPTDNFCSTQTKISRTDRKIRMGTLVMSPVRHVEIGGKDNMDDRKNLQQVAGNVQSSEKSLSTANPRRSDSPKCDVPLDKDHNFMKHLSNRLPINFTEAAKPNASNRNCLPKHHENQLLESATNGKGPIEITNFHVRNNLKCTKLDTIYNHSDCPNSSESCRSIDALNSPLANHSNTNAAKSVQEFMLANQENLLKFLKCCIPTDDTKTFPSPLPSKIPNLSPLKYKDDWTISERSLPVQNGAENSNARVINKHFVKGIKSKIPVRTASYNSHNILNTKTPSDSILTSNRGFVIKNQSVKSEESEYNFKNPALYKAERPTKMRHREDLPMQKEPPVESEIEIDANFDQFVYLLEKLNGTKYFETNIQLVKGIKKLEECNHTLKWLTKRM